PECEVLAGREVAKCLLPVERGHDRLDLAGTQATGIQPAHHSTHTGAGDGIDGDVLLFEDLQYPDVRDTTRAATGKDEADPGSVSRRGVGYGRGQGRGGRNRIRGLLCKSDGPSREPKDRTNNAEYPETGPDHPW